MRVGRRGKNLVLIDGEIAHRARSAALRALGLQAIFPDEVARAAVERLQDVVDVGQVDGAVMHQGRGFVCSDGSFMDHTQASLRSFTLSRVICVSAL